MIRSTLLAVAGLLPLLASAQVSTTAPDIIATNYIIASNPDVEPVNLQITTKDYSQQNDTAPNLYGLMFEDIDHSGDGGIYAELLINRAFQGSPINSNDNPIEPFGPSLTGWYPIGDVVLSLDLFHPLSDALPNALAVTIPEGATGQVGLLNTGWWGMNVVPQLYNASFHVNAVNDTYLNNQTTFTVAIQSNDTGEVWASEQIGPVHIDTFRYVQLNASFYNNATAPNGNNSFTITWDAEPLAGQTLYFTLFSLFPETFKNRPNGLRKDLAEAFYDMKPKFLRCPGGNNIEGQSIQTRMKWWETIGPLKDRPGRIGDWGYVNTDGLGLLEYMYWCEDMEIEPVLAIYSGYSLDGTSYPLEYMDEVLQEALDELEFLLGDTSTKWGAKRAEYGHPAPFKINYVEVGNEDWFSCTVVYRFNYLYPALKKAYPNIRFMSTAFKENINGTQRGCPYVVDLPEGSAYDYHTYQTPSFYLNNFGLFDNYAQENGLQDVEVMLGEYSVFQLDDSNQYVNYSDPPALHPQYPQMIHALGEGVYQLAAERNPQLVTLSAYAPSLQNRNYYVWTPNLISFQAQHNETVLTTSYWQQWLFAHYRGTQTVPVQGPINPLFWVGTVDNSTGALYLKIINTGNQTVPLTIEFTDHSYSSVNGTMLQSDDPNAFNFNTTQDTVVPRTINGTALPQPGGTPNNGTASEGGSSMTTTSYTAPNGQGATSAAPTASATGTSQAAIALPHNKRWPGDNGQGGQVWSWTVPVFASIVLQFNP